jgi:phosphoacetylglucosamine mutase
VQYTLKHVAHIQYSASGTEDAVRVYAEAATRAETDDLAFKVAQLVFDRAGGVGARP